jgi:hypothetical protein
LSDLGGKRVLVTGGAKETGLGVRRLVAGPDGSGKTRVLFDGEAPRRVLDDSSGLHWTQLWSSDAVTPVVAPPIDDPTLGTVAYFPAPGGTRFMINRIPSAADRRRTAANAPASAAERFHEQAPGMAETMEPGGDGMHTSQTIDYGLVLDGEIDIEFDDGVRTRLHAGDTYVLHAARHRWHALEESGCTIAVVLTGAQLVF